MIEFTAETFRHAVDEKTAREIARLLADAPTLDVAWSLYGESQGASATGEDPVVAGKRTFVRRLQELRTIFCANASIRAVVQNSSLDKELDLVTVLAGVLLHQHYPGTEIATIAVLIAKIGVLRLCDQAYRP